MGIRRLGLVAVIAFLVASTAVLYGELKVAPDKENVVASRLVGDWDRDATLTKRLTGNEKSASPEVRFTSDPNVASKLPMKFEKFFANKRIFLSGVLTFGGDKPHDHPFVLIENSGNPHVVWFRERGGDPLGDAESFNVMLAPGKEPQNDLLFIGGDFNNQPFAAFTRRATPQK